MPLPLLISQTSDYVLQEGDYTLCTQFISCIFVYSEVKDQSILTLIAKLTGILLQVEVAATDK